jgi:hypothetical protein
MTNPEADLDQGGRRQAPDQRRCARSVRGRIGHHGLIKRQCMPEDDKGADSLQAKQEQVTPAILERADRLRISSHGVVKKSRSAG